MPHVGELRTVSDGSSPAEMRSWVQVGGELAPPKRSGSWSVQRGPGNQRAYAWSFGDGMPTCGEILIVNPSRSGVDWVEKIDLEVLNIALEWANVMAQRNELAAAVDTIDVGVAIFGGDGSLQWANGSWHSLLGEGTDDITLVQLLTLVAEDVGQEISRFLRGTAMNVGQRLTWETSMQRLSDRPAFWASLTVATADARAGNGEARDVVVVLRDTTDTHESTESLQYQLEHDSLTGTLSRAAIEAKAAAIIAGDPESKSGFALAILDVDNFKLVNDTWGHAAGDELLVGIGNRLRGALEAAHSVGRFGGDEFVLIFCLASASLPECVEAVGRALGIPFVVDDDLEIVISASMGIAEYPRDAKMLDQLVREADRALYHVKTADEGETRWWLSRSELEVSEASHYDPWSPASGRILGRYGEVFDALVNVIEMRLRERLDPEVPLPLDIANTDWVRLHCQLLRGALEASATPSSLQDLLGVAGAELEIASAQKELLSLSSSMVTLAILDDRVGPRIAGRERRLVVDLIMRRFEWVVECEREAMAEVRGTYLVGAMGAPVQETANWDLFLDATLDGVVRLPGVRGVVFSLSESDGKGNLRYLGGDVAPALRDWLGEDCQAKAIFDPSQREGPGDGVYAWEMNTIVRVRNALVAEQYRPWRSIVTRLGFRSLAIVPVMVGVEAIGLCTIYGAFTSQFEGKTPDEFLPGLQRTLEVGWTRLHARSDTLTGEMVQRYRRALNQGGLREYLQPLFDISSGDVTRVELLARLDVGTELVAQPSDFLPAFGPRELIRLFEDSLTRIVGWHQHWSASGVTLGCSVNVPADVLGDRHLREELESARAACDGDLSWLVLELLESDHLTEKATQVVRELAGEGIGFAIDDLGAGYSNLGRLVDLPFVQIKLDRSIIQRLWSRPLSTLAIVDGMVQVGHEAGRSVVFEGVERLELLEVAEILGADYAQGYAIARPMPAIEIEPWVNRFSERVDRSILGTPVSSILGAIAYVWREVHWHGSDAVLDWRDCPVATYLERAFGTKTSVAVLHRRLHQEGLAISSSYQNLVEELDRRHQELLSGESIGAGPASYDGVPVG